MPESSLERPPELRPACRLAETFIMHDLLDLAALVLSGAIGALIVEPLRDALRVARRRYF